MEFPSKETEKDFSSENEGINIIRIKTIKLIENENVYIGIKSVRACEFSIEANSSNENIITLNEEKMIIVNETGVPETIEYIPR